MKRSLLTSGMSRSSRDWTFVFFFTMSSGATWQRCCHDDACPLGQCAVQGVDGSRGPLPVNSARGARKNDKKICLWQTLEHERETPVTLLRTKVSEPLGQEGLANDPLRSDGATELLPRYPGGGSESP